MHVRVREPKECPVERRDQTAEVFVERRSARRDFPQADPRHVSEQADEMFAPVGTWGAGDRLALHRGAELRDDERRDAGAQVGEHGVLEVEPFKRFAAVGDLQYNAAARGSEIKVLVAFAWQRGRFTSNPVELLCEAGRLLRTEARRTVDRGASCQRGEINGGGRDAIRSQAARDQRNRRLRSEGSMLTDEAGEGTRTLDRPITNRELYH